MATIYGYHGSRGYERTNLIGDNAGKKVKIFSGIGFELEITLNGNDDYYCNADKHRITANKIEEIVGKNKLKFERDGSVGDGFEIISQPITTRALKRELPMKRVFNYLNKNGYVSEKGGFCGLHIHVSRAMFGANKQRQNCRLAKVLLFIKNNLEDFKKFSRRKNFNYCSFSSLENYYNNYQEMERFIKENIYNNHSCFINLGNTQTIEFRFFRGTLNHDTFMCNIEFTYNLIRALQYVEIEDIMNNNYEKILKNQPKNVIEYLKNKQLFGYR